jgi:sarcosine oxidase subunit beta
MSGSSFVSWMRSAVGGHRQAGRQWKKASPKSAYDVIIVGGGGHGLATAAYLARDHSYGRIAVLEKAWLGGGNTARNTAIIRSNYLHDHSTAVYDHALGLWSDLSAELGYNVLFSQRGVLTLAHSQHDVRQGQRRVFANGRQGIEAQWLDPQQVAERCPPLDIAAPRWPVLGASWQPAGGVARHDAVVWGYAQMADALGVDIIENCPVSALCSKDGAVTGVETPFGFISAPKVAVVAAAQTAALAQSAGIALPITAKPLQAMVSEPVKPVLDPVVLSSTVGVYVSQTDKGELVFGAGTDAPVSQVARGSWAVVEDQMAAVVALFPSFSRLRLLRTWAGVVDITPDASPLVGETALSGLFINCGWGTGGFKAIPASGKLFAHHLATGTAHDLLRPFALDRFERGALIDEQRAAVVAQ